MTDKDKYPNIDAISFAVDITPMFDNRIRGAAKENIEAAFEIFNEKVVAFIRDLSESLDRRFQN